MTAKPIQKITLDLWYAKGGEEAHASTHRFSRCVDRVTALPSDSPSCPAGSNEMVESTLFGQPFLAISAKLNPY